MTPLHASLSLWTWQWDPTVVLGTLLPAPLWLSLTMVALILSGSIFTVAAYADDIRTSRLRQHGLDVPDDPDLGHPAH